MVSLLCCGNSNLQTKNFFLNLIWKRVIYRFVVSKHGYCNALYTGARQSFLIQNAAATLLTGTKKESSHHSGVGRLFVRYRIRYKLALFVFQALNGLAPANVVDMHPTFKVYFKWSSCICYHCTKTLELPTRETNMDKHQLWLFFKNLSQRYTFSFILFFLSY